MINKFFGKKQKPQFTPTPQRQHITSKNNNAQKPEATDADITKRIYPYIIVNHKHEIYTEVSTETLVDANISANMKPVITSFVEDLQVGFMIDWGTQQQLMPQEVLLQNQALSIERLKGLSLQNLVADYGNSIQLHGMEDNILMVTVGKKHEAALILLENLWQQFSTFFESDDLYFAIPTRNTFLVSAKDNPVGRVRLRTLVRDCFERGDEDFLSKAIYIKEKNGLIRIIDVAF